MLQHFPFFDGAQFEHLRPERVHEQLTHAPLLLLHLQHGGRWF